MSATRGKTRVAIVGGGASALAAAFELTADGRDEQYDVTIYQQGWRLGGKCASGRRPMPGGGERIEEHGLHVFFGCYENTRNVLGRCLGALAESEDPYAFSSFEDAFESLDHIVLGQFATGEWDFVELEFPSNPRAPRNFGDFVDDALRWVGGRLEQLVLEHGLAGHEEAEARWTAVLRPLRELDVGDAPAEARVGELNRGTSRLSRELTTIFTDVAAAVEALREPLSVVDSYRTLVDGALPDADRASAEVRFFRDTAEILFAVLRGVWGDRLLERGFDAINDVDLAEWLGRHGLELAADPLEWPALLRAVYDGCFAFEGGEPSRPRMAAGRAVQGAVRCLFHYEGSVLRRPRSSMSDSVIGPMARYLEQHGVDIRYFHAVKEVHVSADGRRIEALDVVEQVDVASLEQPVARDIPFGPGGPDGTVTAWPAVPPQEVLPEDVRGTTSGVELEREIDPFGGREVRIEAGDEEHGFDWVILAVPPDVQRLICRPLRDADPAYDRMLSASASVVTQAVQLWLDRSAEHLGQDFSSASLLSCYVEPLDTYADMAHLRHVEEWPEQANVHHIAYFCGVLPDATLTGQEAADDAVTEVARRFLDDDVHGFWPGAGDGTVPPAFDARILVPPAGGRDPLAQQYLRANWAHTERYVLTLPGSVQDRLAARGTRFDNLALAGDWTANGMDAGCLEAAVTSGRLAARAVSGAPPIDQIPGVNGPPGFPSAPATAGSGSRGSGGLPLPGLGAIGPAVGAVRSVVAGTLRLAQVAVDVLEGGDGRPGVPGIAALRRSGPARIWQRR